MADPEDVMFRARRSSDAPFHSRYAEASSSLVAGTRGCAKASTRRPSLNQLTVKQSCRQLFSCNKGDDDALLQLKSHGAAVAPGSLGLSDSGFPGKENCSANVANNSPTYAGESLLKNKPFAQILEAPRNQNHPPQRQKARRAAGGSRLQRSTVCEHADGEDDAHSLHSAWANVNEEPADPPPSVSPTRRSSDPMAKLAYNLSEPIPTLYVAEEDAGGRAQGVATAKSAEGGLTHDPDMPLSSLAKKAQSMEFTLNRPAKTPVMVRLRRGSSYKFRAIEDDDQGDAPEEDPEHGDAVYPDEDAVYLDEDPIRLYEDLVPSESPLSPDVHDRVGRPPATAVLTPNISPTKAMGTPHGIMQWSQGGPYLPSGAGHRRTNSNQSSCFGDASLLQDACMHTPEMCAVSPVNEHVRPNMKLYRKVSGKEKRVILVRHGESTFNQTDSTSTSWADPVIFDPPLTRQGVCQALALKQKLCGMTGLETALWVCSPLSRAIETMRYACPFNVEELVARNQLHICAETTELLHTTGDIGLTASDLRRKFPDMAPAMADLPECWWYGTLEYNNPWRKLCKQLEPKASEERRITAFRKMLEERSERVVICFGHSLFWKHFIGGKDRKCLKNCEMHELTI